MNNLNGSKPRTSLLKVLPIIVVCFIIIKKEKGKSTRSPKTADFYLIFEASEFIISNMEVKPPRERDLGVKMTHTFVNLGSRLSPFAIV